MPCCFSVIGGSSQASDVNGGRISICWSDPHDVWSADVSTCRCRSTEFLESAHWCW